MSRPLSLALVFLCWAAIYLPGLGALEIKGEEGRRILPAVTMLDTGNYLVPQVGSEPYFRKPPLVNWVVAASFKWTGVRNEWTARLPSIVCVLLVALAFVTVARPSLGPNGSLFAALIWLANFGLAEKGRLIEIEALYVSLFALALICWLAWWRQRRSSWLAWTVPWIFLGLGLLAKGPLHLFFFYSVVVAVLYFDRELGRLFHPAHFVGLLLMSGIFAAWAIPYWDAIGDADVARQWSVQLTGRLTGADFKLGSWLMNVPRGLAYFLPWTLLLPLVAKTEWNSDGDRALARALGWGALFPFVVVNLLPGGLPRYSLPALVPACWLMAMVFAAPRVSWGPKIWKGAARFRFVVGFALVAGLLMAIYACAVVPRLESRSKVKPIAAQIDELVPDKEPLYALDPDYQPFLFYLQTRLVYVSRLNDVPLTARYLLVQPEREAELLASERWSPRRPAAIERITDYRKHTIVLLKVSE